MELVFFFSMVLFFALITGGSGASNDIIFPFRPQERQSIAAQAMSPFAAIKIVAFGGPKFGGKSWTILYIAAMMAMSRPLKVLVIGHKFEDMKSLHIEPLERWLDDYIQAGLVKPYNATNKVIEIPAFNSVIKFQQVTRDADARSLNGQAWDIVLIDEAQKQTPFTLSYLQGICRVSHTQSRWRNKLRTLFRNAKKDLRKSLLENANRTLITEKRVDAVIDYFMGKVSSKDLAIDKKYADKLMQDNRNYVARMKDLRKQWDNTYYIPKMLYCFNWGERGHSWLKRIFWDGCKHEGDPFLRVEKFAKNEETGEFIENPEDYRFIFAPMEDNEIGMKEDPGYRARIMSMEEPYRTAYLTGDPSAFAGMMYEIHPHIHEVNFDAFLRSRGFVIEAGSNSHPPAPPSKGDKPTRTYIPEHWSLYACIDAGANCSAGLYTKTPEGISIQIADYNGDNKDPLSHINEMVADWLRCPWTRARLPDIVFSDKYGFAKHQKNQIRAHDITWEDLFWEHHSLNLYKIDEDRVTSAMALRTALAYETDEEANVTRKPTLLFAKRDLGEKDANGFKKYKRICEYTIEQIVSLEPDDRRPDDWAHGPGIEDHAADKTKNYVLGASSPPPLPNKKEAHYAKDDYGMKDENFDGIEEADYEDISTFGDAGIGGFGE